MEERKLGSDSLTGASGEEPDFRNELHSTMNASKDGEKRRRFNLRPVDDESKGEEKEKDGDGDIDEMAYLRIQMQMMDGTLRPRYRF